jgi:hypothetical protein
LDCKKEQEKRNGSAGSAQNQQEMIIAQQTYASIPQTEPAKAE